METRAYQYVIDPAALKQLITGHIRWFWMNYLQAEWARVRPILEESAKAFNQIDYSDMTRVQMIEFVTDKCPMIPEGHLLSTVEGVFNAIYIKGDVVGPTLFYGQGGADADR